MPMGTRRRFDPRRPAAAPVLAPATPPPTPHSDDGSDSRAATVTGTTVGTIQVLREVFRAEKPFNERYPHTLVVDCSDGRFAGSDEEFLAATFGEPHADQIEIPGGAALFHLMAAVSVADVDVLRAKTKLLVDGHSTTRIVLMMHEGCRHYEFKYPGLPHEEVVRSQLADLVVVARDLKGRYPAVEVRAFYKRVSGGYVTFDEVLFS